MADMTNVTTPTILIIDDDSIQRSVIRSIAMRNGYFATCAESVEQAADQIRSHPFDFITVDLSLGDRDGIELLRMIGLLNPVPRVIVISGCEDRILTATVRMANAVGIVQATSLRKPLDLAALRMILQSRRLDAHVASAEPAQFVPNETQIEIGIKNSEFRPAFQPKIRLSDNAIVGCEALARWDIAGIGSIPPAFFVPIAEQAGLIKPITLSILSQSLAATHDFIRRDPNFVVAVNISAMLLSDLTFPEEVEQLLEDNAVPARSLMLEITETIAMSDLSRAMDVLLRLRLKGIGLSIDDFGTGYSSLTALARMPFSELKIDRSFVYGSLADADLWKIVRGSVALGHEFNMKVVAEGIEDDQTRAALGNIGCDVGQGYEFSPALSKDAFIDWCKRWNSDQHDATHPIMTPQSAA
jgi:EAL domain-containing protein (putative c-di-GMP-specific phosphodiesterase class I)/ActR/RegA family two-component response regulator